MGRHHTPNGNRNDASDVDQVLDAREIEGEPFGEIMTVLEELSPGETFLLKNSFEPEPLYSVLTQRGFGHETEHVDEELWHVTIEHVDTE